MNLIDLRCPTSLDPSFLIPILFPHPGFLLDDVICSCPVQMTSWDVSGSTLRKENISPLPGPPALRTFDSDLGIRAGADPAPAGESFKWVFAMSEHLLKL